MANYKIKKNNWSKTSKNSGWNKGGKKTKWKSNKKSRRDNSASLTALAHQMGLVKRGLQNPDSRISEAYNRGLVKPEKRPRKTLF